MALRSPYRYVAETTDKDGRHLGELVLDPDFEPAAEWSYLQGVRSGALPARTHYGPGVIDPVFDEVRGRPYVQGLRMRFDAAPPAHAAPVIPWRYFQQAVEQSAVRLVDAQKLRAGESLIYRICAFARPPAATAAERRSSTRVTTEAAVPLALERAALSVLLAGAGRLAAAAWHDGDFPLFMHHSVLDEAHDLARAAGERETGGILIGHLRRDVDTPEIHAEITAQIPATQARAGPTHLGFTPETWSAMSDALALRRRNEIMLGWWHHHPFFCAHCAPEQRRGCALLRPFFSRDDVQLHRAVFDAAFNVALLLSDTGSDALSCDLFGWRHGSVTARGCYLLSPRDCAPPTANTDDAERGAARILSVREK